MNLAKRQTSTTTNTSKKCRLFLGIPIAKEIYRYLKKLIAEKHPHLPEGKFTPEENAHLTVRFFGDIEEYKILWLCEAITERIQKNIKPFVIQIKKIALFPNQHGSIIAAYCDDNLFLTQFITSIHSITLENAYQDNKELIPHVTLYRLKNKTKIAFSEIPIKNMTLPVEQVILYESQLIEDAHVYQKIKIFSF